MSLTCCAPRTDCKKSYAVDAESAGTYVLISADAAAGYAIMIRAARIVQGAAGGATIVLKAGSATILTVDPVNFEGSLTDYLVDGQEVSVVISGAGTASATVSTEWF